MANYEEVRVKLNKLKSAAKNNTDIKIRITKKLSR